MNLSIVVPFFNEEENVLIFYQRLKKVLEEINLRYEILFIDDGSTDTTLEKLERLAINDPQIKLVKFDSNCGQNKALAAGIDLAEGEIIITLDGDLQHAPEDIPRFIERMKRNYDIICGWRVKREDRLFRKYISVAVNKIFKLIFKMNIHDFGCSYRAYRKEVISKIKNRGGLIAFLFDPKIGSEIKIDEIAIEVKPRQAGRSKYTITKNIFLFCSIIKILIKRKNRD